ncbi:MAG: RNA polymerase sigma factor [Planctomycetaceae bacterium]|jgi:RNA polymerase sigma-70 factor (ECF subfamily)|nr:RNA polymerase sigma factor [Planctomycetaceae bacterium]MBX3419042.1 RNA polymerase sigma factor [Pirellulaceae bacterium]HMO16094.1 RNA polymerase sigma factor [Pirellulaceae bacterium]HMO94194.1 RNA polymerase sigma factor [Pirellulaceae bacterium]HMP71255.1 RNA polymerase sigma factor [Pirellulaceae bacterium]
MSEPEPDNLLEQEIVRRAARGDRDAQRQIYEHYGHRALSTIKRIVGSSDAEDVLQDAFIRLFDKLPTFRFESEFSTWMHRLVVNEALQRLRKRVQKVTNTESLPSEVLDTHNRGMNSQEDVEIIKMAMNQIQPELRRMFELKVLDELSYAQISEIIGIPEGTVGSRLNRARRELQNQLVQLGWEI